MAMLEWAHTPESVTDLEETLRKKVLPLKPEYIVEDTRGDYFSSLYHARGFLEPQGTIYERDGENLSVYLTYNPFTYAKTLFLTDEGEPIPKERLRLELEDKSILVLGGGNSLVDLCSSRTIKPRKIVDIDPFRFAESIEKGVNGNYESFAYAAEDIDLVEKLSKFGTFDEIWGLYSVPHYLRTEKDIRSLFYNIEHLLAPRGTARIYPLTLNTDDLYEVLTNSGEDAFRYAAKQRVDALIDSILKLQQNGLSVEIIKNTLLIKKP